MVVVAVVVIVAVDSQELKYENVTTVLERYHQWKLKSEVTNRRVLELTTDFS